MKGTLGLPDGTRKWLAEEGTLVPYLKGRNVPIPVTSPLAEEEETEASTGEEPV